MGKVVKNLEEKVELLVEMVQQFVKQIIILNLSLRRDLQYQAAVVLLLLIMFYKKFML